MIAFDLDEVILNLTGVLSKPIEDLTNIDISNRTEFYIYPKDMSKNKFRKIFNKLLIENTPKAKPIDGSIDALMKIYKLIDTPIHIITARNKESKQVTEKWLKENIKNKFPYEITFSGGVPKYKFFKPGTKYFVDDALHNVEKLQNHLDVLFLFDRPWNRKKTGYNNVIRIKDLHTVYIFLKRYNKF
jgi:uncharacterized HAD superfamily protein